MILKHLKNSHSYLMILFIIFCLLFFSTSFFTEKFQNIENIFPFYSVCVLLCCCVITCFHSIGLNNLVYEKDVIKKPNFVTAFVFLLLNTTFVTNHEMILFSFVLLFFLYYLLSLYKQKQPYSLVFNAGLIISLLSFYLPNILVFVVLILISSIIFRNINWRIIFLSILPLFVPYFFLWTYQIINGDSLYFADIEFSLTNLNFNVILLNFHEMFWYSILSLVSILSIYELFRWMYKKSIRSRESFTIIVFYLLISILVFLFTKNTDSIILIFTPLSIIIGNFFVYYKKERVGGFIFILFLFSSVFYRLSMINM